jgi:hypothetical protein
VTTRIARLAAVATAAAALAAQSAAGAGTNAKPLAGPWYTPAEAKALQAYANASAAGKKLILEGRLAGPSYTPKELAALKAYAAASFAGKRRILAGGGSTVASRHASRSWPAVAAIGAGVVVATLLVVVGVAGFGVLRPRRAA